LTAETVDVLYRLDAIDKVVGVSGYTVFPPEARAKPFVSAFTTIRYDVIDMLKPDLIIGFSDLQAEAATELGKRGHTVLLTNQRTLSEMFETLVMIGRIVGKGAEAEALVVDLQEQLEATRRASRSQVIRPRVYFEEWDEPLISGISWIGDLIEAAGGDDIFPELRETPNASGRVVKPETVIARAPDIIIASWCGKKANLEAICVRPGWPAIPAIHDGQVHEIKSAYCLQPGPRLITEGLPRFRTIIKDWRTKATRDT
jgi:iron complex transport system substrate-binding protein